MNKNNSTKVDTENNLIDNNKADLGSKREQAYLLIAESDKKKMREYINRHDHNFSSPSKIIRISNIREQSKLDLNIAKSFTTCSSRFFYTIPNTQTSHKSEPVYTDVHNEQDYNARRISPS